VLVYMMHSIHRHYSYVSAQLEHPDRRPVDRRLGDHHFVILATGIDTAVARAVGYLRSVRSSDVVAVTFDSGACGGWARLAPEIPVHVLEPSPSESAALKAWLRARRDALDADDFLTVVVPEVLCTGSLVEVARHPRLHRLKASLLAEAGVQVMDVPVVRERVDPNVDHAKEPARRSVVVLTSALHNGTLQAIEYGEALGAADIRAVHFALDAAEAEDLGIRWLDAGVPIPLEIEDSPFRDIGTALVAYLKRMEPGGMTHIVTVVIPEMVVGTRRHQLLHGQSALILKRHLLAQGGVVTVSVPYHV
jgi:hypothetical protein